MNSAARFPDVRKIAVLRANAIGDFMFSLPAIEAIKAAYPDAELVLLGQPWHEKFLAGRPGPVDRAIAIPPSEGVHVPREGGHASPEELDEFFKGMQQEQFDLAVQLHGGGRFSNPFTKRLGARFTVGLRSPDAIPLDRSVPYHYWQHEVMRNLEVAALTGAVPVTLEPRVTVTASDLAEAERVIPAGSRPLVALHPGAGDPRRRWSAEYFAEVGDALAAEGAQVVVTGAGSEADIARVVVGGMREDAVDTAGRLSLGGLAGLLSRCALVISNDSGPLHLAGAVGASTIGIYWCGNVINAGALTRTHHRVLLSWRLECPECGTNCMTGHCDHRPSFTNDVTPEEVLREARDLLAMQGVALNG